MSQVLTLRGKEQTLVQQKRELEERMQFLQQRIRAMEGALAPYVRVLLVDCVCGDVAHLLLVLFTT